MIEAKINSDFRGVFRLGNPLDRWRLDDVDIVAHLRPAAGAAEILHEVSTDDGTIVVTDARLRTCEVQIDWTTLREIGPGSFAMDFQFTDRTTAEVSSSDTFVFRIVDGVTVKTDDVPVAP